MRREDWATLVIALAIGDRRLVDRPRFAGPPARVMIRETIVLRAAGRGSIAVHATTGAPTAVRMVGPPAPRQLSRPAPVVVDQHRHRPLNHQWFPLDDAVRINVSPTNLDPLARQA